MKPGIVHLAHQCIDLFGGRISLVVSDIAEDHFLMIERLLHSPLLRIIRHDTVGVFGRTERIQRFHCVLVSGEGCVRDEHSTADVFSKSAPFTIVLHNNIRTGTMLSLFRKGTRYFVNTSVDGFSDLIFSVCRLAPLAYLTRGKIPSHLNVFSALTEKVLTSADHWSEAAFLSKRRLREICSENGIEGPTRTIRFYYGIQFLLQYSILGSAGVERSDTFDSSQLSFFEKCLRYLYTHERESPGPRLQRHSSTQVSQPTHGPAGREIALDIARNGVSRLRNLG